MIKKLLIGIGSLVVLSTLPAAADGKDCDCEQPKTLSARVPSTEIRWVDIPPQMITDCKIFYNMASSQVVEGSCNEMYVRCSGNFGTLPQQCQARMVVVVVREVVETEKRIVEPTVRERIIEREAPVVRERTVVRHRHVERERERDTGGSWYPINHRDTMDCWGRRSIARGSTRLRHGSGHAIGMCRGRYTKCIGGSEDRGTHRQCWARR